MVLIANPEIADVVVNSPRTIFLLGKQRGKTSLFILGIDGQDILRSEIIVKEAAVPVGPKAVGIAGPKVIKLYRSVTPESVVLPATQ